MFLWDMVENSPPLSTHPGTYTPQSPGDSHRACRHTCWHSPPHTSPYCRTACSRNLADRGDSRTARSPGHTRHWLQTLCYNVGHNRSCHLTCVTSGADLYTVNAVMSFRAGDLTFWPSKSPATSTLAILGITRPSATITTVFTALSPATRLANRVTFQT